MPTNEKDLAQSNQGVSPINRRPLITDSTTINKVKPINPLIYTATMWGGVAVIFLSFLIGDKNSVLAGLIVMAGMASAGFAFVYFLVCLYRSWSVLKGHSYKATPVKAVAFLFIPIFNIIWVWTSLKGLAEDANLYCRKMDIDFKMGENLAFFACIVHIIPWVDLLAPVFENILVYQWSAFINASNAKFGGEVQPKPAMK